MSTGKTSSSPGVRNPGLRFRWIVFVLRMCENEQWMIKRGMGHGKGKLTSAW